MHLKVDTSGLDEADADVAYGMASDPDREGSLPLRFQGKQYYVHGEVGSFEVRKASPTKAPPANKQKKEPACPPNKILNPATNRCVKKDGAIGKKLLVGRTSSPKKAATPTFLDFCAYLVDSYENGIWDIDDDTYLEFLESFIEPFAEKTGVPLPKQVRDLATKLQEDDDDDDD